MLKTVRRHFSNSGSLNLTESLNKVQSNNDLSENNHDTEINIDYFSQPHSTSDPTISRNNNKYDFAESSNYQTSNPINLDNVSLADPFDANQSTRNNSVDENFIDYDSNELASDTAKTFGINGFGRIGRTAFRVWWLFHKDKLNLKQINTSGSMEIGDWAHLLKYDSNYGVFNQEIKVERTQSKDEVSDDNPVLGTLTIGDYKVLVTAQRNPDKIQWAKNGVKTVIESTGAFNSEEKASLHFQGGAENVILSAPAKGGGGNVQTIVLGVNNDAPRTKVLSNASCTTNCVGPVTQIINSSLGIDKATMTTIHAYTDDQNLHDNSHKDLRRSRAAAQNIVPTSTGATIAVTEIIPQLKGLFEGISMRVPIAVGSISDMVFVTSRETSVDEINDLLTQASQEERWRGILAVTSEPLVSSDIVGRRESSIVDLNLTQVIGGNLVKVVAWYDNEWGYCNRLIEQITHI